MEIIPAVVVFILLSATIIHHYADNCKTEQELAQLIMETNEEITEVSCNHNFLEHRVKALEDATGVGKKRPFTEPLGKEEREWLKHATVKYSTRFVDLVNHLSPSLEKEEK